MKIAVIGGGGWIGSPTAFHMATRGLADEIVLIDVRRACAEQHAVDMRTAVAMLGVEVKAGEYADMADTDVVINTAGVPHIGNRSEMLAKNTYVIRDIVEQIRTYCPEALVITATNPVDPLNYATFRAGGFSRQQVIGYSLNDSFRFRESVAASKGVAVGAVAATVIGEHGPLQVPLFSSVSIGGERVNFAEAEKQVILTARHEAFGKIEVLQKETGRTAGWTCAVGLAQVVAAVAADTGEVFPASVILEGEYGLSNLSMGVPVKLGRSGVQEILEWDLAADEQAALAVCAARLAADCRSVDRALSG